MYIPRSFIVALLSAPFLAYAQSSDANPFNNPSGGYQVTAGKPLTLSWKPTTGGTVSLLLRMGNSGDLDTVTTIASNLPNDGSYTWNVPSDAVRGSSYTIEIQSDQDSSEVNYTPQFILESTNNAAPTTSTASTAASTVTPSTTSGATSSSAMSMSSDSASSSMTSMTDSTMSTATSTGSSSSASESNASTSSNGDLVASQTSSVSAGGAARATAMAGMLGVVALGALAL